MMFLKSIVSLGMSLLFTTDLVAAQNRRCPPNEVWSYPVDGCNTCFPTLFCQITLEFGCNCRRGYTREVFTGNCIRESNCPFARSTTTITPGTSTMEPTTTTMGPTTTTMGPTTTTMEPTTESSSTTMEPTTESSTITMEPTTELSSTTMEPTTESFSTTMEPATESDSTTIESTTT